jgi:proliferating cell nuclear antigen
VILALLPSSHLRRDSSTSGGANHLASPSATLADIQASKKSKTSDDSSEPGVSIILEKQVSLTFSLKYLSNFAKSAPLAREVSLHMSNDVPLLVQFDFEQGTLQFFLAPKVGLFLFWIDTEW